MEMTKGAKEELARLFNSIFNLLLLDLTSKLTSSSCIAQQTSSHIPSFLTTFLQWLLYSFLVTISLQMINEASTSKSSEFEKLLKLLRLIHL